MDELESKLDQLSKNIEQMRVDSIRPQMAGPNLRNQSAVINKVTNGFIVSIDNALPWESNQAVFATIEEALAFLKETFEK